MNEQDASLMQTKTHKIAGVLSLALMARPNNSEILGDDDFTYLAKEIAKDYHYLTTGELYHIISLGIKGWYGKDQEPINSKTLYRWIGEGKVYCFSYWYNQGEPEKKGIDYLLEHFYSREELTHIAAKGAAYCGFGALLNLYIDAQWYQWRGHIVEKKRTEKIPVDAAINHILKRSKLVV